MTTFDPHAANDCAVLLAKSAIADGNVYVPNLFIRSWAEGAPGLWARIAAWLAMIALLARWVVRARRDGHGEHPLRALAALAAVVLVVGLALERWPSRRTSARLRPAS